MLKLFSAIFICLTALLLSYQLGGQSIKQWIDCSYSTPATATTTHQYANETGRLLKSATPIPIGAGWNTSFELRNTVSSDMPYYEFTGTLEKSPSDPRQLRLIHLVNNMTVLCIYDPDSIDSAASLSVDIGYQYSPPELLGLTHFLEHMLFQGSKKYPGENEYFEYISRFAGYANAYTSEDETCYHFSLPNNGFEGALDRFSKFFIDPLLRASSVDKEVLAVDSEFKGNIMNDRWRGYHVFKKVTNPKHPFSQFVVGSTESLKDSAKKMGVDLHAELLKLHDKYYSSDIMKLVIAGNHTLDQLTEWAVSKFSEAKSKGNPKKVLENTPLGKDELGQLVYVEALGDGQSMELVFALPGIKNAYRTGAIEYIHYMFGSQSEGSIYYYLQKNGWISMIDASINSMNSDSFNMLFINAELTSEGMEHWDDIVCAIFAYLQMLSEQGPQEWYHEELRKTNNLENLFYQKSNVHQYVSHHAGILHNEYIRPEHVMTAGKIIGSFDSVMVADLLSYLHPDNYMLILTSKQHKNVECELTEKYYGTKYHVDKLPASLTTNPGTSPKYHNLFRMPSPNVFIPSSLDMDKDIPVAKDVNASVDPVYLKGNDKMELWFKKDHQFFTPRGAIHIDIHVASINTPFYEALTSIYNKYLNEILYNELQPALLAGINYDFNTYVGGVIIQITGFSEKQKLLLEVIIKKIKSVVVDEQLFKMYVDLLVDDYLNYRNKAVVSHASIFLKHIYNEPNWHYTQVLPELTKISMSDLQNFADHIVDQAFFTALVAGDFTENDALDIANTVDVLLNSTVLPNYLQTANRAISLDSGYFIYQEAAPEKDTLNSAVVSTIYCGDASNIDDVMALVLLRNIIHEPFFDQIRTKEQLGYYVTVTSQLFKSAQYLSFIIQGESSPAYTTMRAESFIHSFHQQLIDFSEDKLSLMIGSLVENLLDRPKTVFDEASNLWSEIVVGNYEFDLVNKKVQAMQKMTKAYLLKFWDRYINPETASLYKRLDSQIWSSHTIKPTKEHFGKYSQGVIALQGSLHQEGITNVSLSVINDIVISCLSSGQGIDLGLKMVQGIIASDGQYTDEVLAKVIEPRSKTRIALEMAVDQAVKAFSFAAPNSQNFTKIGMQQSPDGVWLINNIQKFKSSQQLLAKKLPFNQPQPVY